VINSIRKRWPAATVGPATLARLREARYLLVTLTWWKDCYEYVWWFSQMGLNLSRRQPIVIVGGQAIANPAPLAPFFHVAVIGDGEACIVPIIEALEGGADPTGLPGVWHPSQPVTPAVAPEIPAEPYCEERKAPIARIELARGCRHRCPFCQVAWAKPYREQTLPHVLAQLAAITTKRVSCFAPNRTGYTHLEAVMAEVHRRGLVDCGSDTRLDTVRRFARINSARFGVEGFSERTRKLLHKVPTNADLRDGLLYLAQTVRRLDGSPMRSAEAYLIGDLPGEGRPEHDEFWDVLREVDARLSSRFTLFLSVSSFAPSPHTPMAHCGIRPYDDWSFLPRAGVRREHAGRGKLRHLVIACRGGIAPAPARLCQMLLARGDARVARVVLWLSTVPAGQAAYRASGRQAHHAARQIEAACRAVGFPPEHLTAELPPEHVYPWSHIAQAVTPCYRWPRAAGGDVSPLMPIHASAKPAPAS
jgi:hypothetical protein